jgi:hypothetical protein
MTINDLSTRAGELFATRSLRAGLPVHSPIIFALTSGIDVALTLIEQSTGARFRGLTPGTAQTVVQYFRDEAARSCTVHRQVVIFYESWADTIAATYLESE